MDEELLKEQAQEIEKRKKTEEWQEYRQRLRSSINERINFGAGGFNDRLSGLLEEIEDISEDIVEKYGISTLIEWIESDAEYEVGSEVFVVAAKIAGLYKHLRLT